MNPQIIKQVYAPMLILIFVQSLSVVLQGCSGNDPKEKPNEKESITGVNLTIWVPDGLIEPYYDLILRDDDKDGTFAPDETFPTITFPTNTEFGVYTSFFENQGEIEIEKDDHLICFVPTNGVMLVSYDDQDSKGLPFGVSTKWTTGANEGSGQLTISLRHQPGVKTGVCPGEGENDVQLIIPIEISN